MRRRSSALTLEPSPERLGVTLVGEVAGRPVMLQVGHDQVLGKWTRLARVRSSAPVVCMAETRRK
jgi:hypothetical protein